MWPLEPEGILLVDKPSGLTSHDVVQKVKSALDVKKAGHLGTLDPAATGLLVVCINGATKIAQFMREHDKEYLATLRLGIKTDTQDAEGEVIATADVDHLNSEDIKEAFAGFKGAIEQRPPMYSAVKIDGKPMHRLARAGKRPVAPVRTVQVKQLEVENIDMPRVSFRAVVSAGTYIRTLAHDIGKKLGVGAHIEYLRRTRSGPFKIENAIPLDKMNSGPGSRTAFGAIIPLRDALAEWPEILVEGEAARRVAHGNWLTREDFERGEARLDGQISRDMAKVVNNEGRMIAVMRRFNDGKQRQKTGERDEALWRPMRVWGN